MQKLYIKNMVCPRCIKVVREEIEKFGFSILDIKLGEVQILEDLDQRSMTNLAAVLEKNGFELLEDRKSKLINRIKTEIISIIQNYSDEDISSSNFSEYLSNKLNKDYGYLSSLFSKTEGITIEHFIILQKIEKAKELLHYGELTLSEIAYSLGYSSVQHLSRQFKNVTGMTASQFKESFTDLRKPIDGI